MVGRLYFPFLKTTPGKLEMFCCVSLKGNLSDLVTRLLHPCVEQRPGYQGQRVTGLDDSESNDCNKGVMRIPVIQYTYTHVLHTYSYIIGILIYTYIARVSNIGGPI